MNPGNPNWQKGVSGNPSGRPKGVRNKFSIFAFEEALSKVEKDKGKSLYEHAIERAYVNDKVLVALIGRIIPQVDSFADDDDDLVNEEIGFVDVPENGEGKNRFKEFLN